MQLDRKTGSIPVCGATRSEGRVMSSSSKKQSDPWDDSALLNAFDDAITKYKKMHKKEGGDRDNLKNAALSLEEEEEHHHHHHVTLLVDEETPAQTILLVSSKDVVNANDPSLIGENYQSHLNSQEPYKQTSDGAHMQQVPEARTNTQGMDAYNELLNKYYELEEQRQKVLEQLQETGYWNHQYSDEASGPSRQWGTCSIQGNQNYNQQAFHPTVASYCCACVCPCLVAPSSLMPACSSGGASVSNKYNESTSIACTKGPEKFPSVEDDIIAKTAIGAAEQAISSMNLNASSTSNIHEGPSEGQMAQNIRPDTDLSIVLNAWYSAGFYTSKYLFEQSISKGKHG